MRCEHGRQSNTESVEALRDSFIKAGRQGQHLLVNLDTQAPDFKTVYTNTEAGNFAVDIAFDRDRWRNPEIHKLSLFSRENYSHSNKTNFYFMMPEHTMQIRSTAPNEAAIFDVLSKIPHVEKFKHIIIE